MRLLNLVAMLNVALVFTHQVDAAYWREWEMFGLPGGIQLFNVFNLVIFFVVLVCLVTVLGRRTSGFRNSLVIATLSGVVLPIHAAFALAGHEQFHLPFSIALILGTFLASVLQVALTLRARPEFGKVASA